MIPGEVQREEIVALVLDFRTDGAREPELAENVADLIDDLRDEVKPGPPGGAPRHGEIQPRHDSRGVLEGALARGKGGLELALERVRGRPDLLLGGRVEPG